MNDASARPERRLERSQDTSVRVGKVVFIAPTELDETSAGKITDFRHCRKIDVAPVKHDGCVPGAVDDKNLEALRRGGAASPIGCRPCAVRRQQKAQESGSANHETWRRDLKTAKKYPCFNPLRGA